ncbi:nucleotide pyrophosphohydrolase [bacterium]|nr:nucleotide pyrophosphohydrolase [bacterium]
MEIREFQDLMHKLYYSRDKKRGLARTFVWFIEEVGELAKLIREDKKSDFKEEVGDVFAWLLSLANLLDVNVEKEIEKYKEGCPKCKKIPCQCTYDTPSFQF